MNKLYLCAALFTAVFVPKVYAISPNPALSAKTPPGAEFSQETSSNEASILLEAHQLALAYGIRPYWQETPLSKGEIPPPGEVDDIIAHLIPCENIGRLLRPGTVDKILDSNDRYSYGLLMFQSSTWQGVEAGAGFTGSPLDTLNAIQGARWSILHGYLWWWSCASILGIVSR